ncbi:Growth arrest-specific protein 8-like [Hondaea fermentalgiana]|uniref:Growth arrest-specific protein 8-like n=1 Tax=Hondaea fermentalgiana TaxID=2315210 RepID=A0A2R5GQ88_9STRA|nr:Growth arrest-specific protein 8-like [Hondaea fermentalgiana]|eukprot:GBG32775.1 Growth arrest-specific protein 8-like [Hondaea fermentalgiana]
MGKGKKKGGKKGDDGGAGNAEAEARLALVRQAKDLKRQVLTEQQQFNEFQQQREKINYFWIVEKKNLEDKKAEVRNKHRELQDLEERHQVEIKVYKQRVKHLLYEHQNEVTFLKADCNNSLRLEEDKHRHAETELKKDERALKIELKETELSHEDFIKSLKQEQDRRITELRQNFERRARELQLKHERRSRVLREQLEAQRKADIQRIEQRKDSHIDELMKTHEKAFAEIKNYYNDITHNNLDLIKSLKEGVSEMKKKESADEKLMFEIAQENKRMSEPLKQALQDVERLRGSLEEYTEIKARLSKTKVNLGVVQDQLKALQWENEVLGQRFEMISSERKNLYDQLQSSVFDVQQKTGLKNILLEKKVTLLDRELEKTDGYLSEILKQFNLDPSTLGIVQAKVRDILEAKNAAVSDLSQSITAAVGHHNKMLEAYESKLGEYGIAVQEVGFELHPLKIPASGF